MRTMRRYRPDEYPAQPYCLRNWLCRGKAPARARLAAIAAQVHQELFGKEDAGEEDGEREEAGMVPVG